MRYRVKLDGQTLTSEIMSSEWLPSAILAVSNAAAMTARQSIDHSIAAFEANISEKIYLALRKVYAESRIMREFSVDGQSGKQHNFDYAVGNIDSKILLLDAISPHHSSIAHKYTSFSDVKSALNGLAVTFAVYDRPLDPEDVSLMQQVSDLVPINSVSSGAERVLQ